MAGIAGIFRDREGNGIVEKMLGSIKHRGPDSTSIYQKGEITAGVVASKLSEARGNGFAREGNIAVFFDGEIYNKRGPGESDAEVVLDLYARYGQVSPAYLDGVFACAVWNGSEVFLARDAVGVRPLFFGKTRGGKLCFASEMKALVGIAADVRELGPATTYSSNNGLGVVMPRYPEVEIPSTPEAAAKKLREYLFRAVEKHLEDGAVGGMLISGGLDSSVIAAIVHELDPGIGAFTVGAKGAPDLESAAIIAKHYGIEHHIYTFGIDEVTQLVPKAVRVLESFDEDCVSGTIANLIASSFASKTTNCILSGEGGDELNGGYHLLKELPTDEERLKTMRHLIDVAYNTALQRLDRAMMGNSINYRIPFLDSEVVAFCLQIPVRWKIYPAAGGKLIEKWLLREAFKDMLPVEIYTREKQHFSGGTMIDNLIDKVAEGKIGEHEFNEGARHTPTGYYLNTPKELWYYRLFKKNFPLPAFEKLVGRWDPTK